MRSTIRAVAGVLLATGISEAQDRSPVPAEAIREARDIWYRAGTTRISGRHEVLAGSTHDGSLAVVLGPLRLGGTVRGDVVAFNADVTLEPGAVIRGQLMVLGGRLVGRDSAVVDGTVRVWNATLHASVRGDSLVLSTADQSEPGDRWWRRPERWRRREWGDIRLVSARTYNRVEGLPVQLGPAYGREFSWGRLSVDALGVLRSVNRFEWTPDNVGHSARIEFRSASARPLRIGARHVDVVDAVEPWQLSDSESGLAAFFLHRDLRDYFNRHGGSVYASVMPLAHLEVGASFADQRWSSRVANDPWTLFRDTQAWRDNPAMDDGRYRSTGLSVQYDTRTDDRSPWSGWLASLEYEYGDGVTRRYGPTSDAVRLPTVGGRTTWDRAVMDVRRYMRVSPVSQLNLRIAGGGWLSGDELPLQRRLSLGGPGTLPGFDFRGAIPGTDVLTCGSGVALAGMPAQCERFALAQVEFRGALQLDPFGILDNDRDWRRKGWGRGTQFVVFADAGRGWLVGDDRSDPRQVRRSRLPALSSFATDVGVGLMLDDVGLYLAKAVSHGDAPVNFILRLRPRF